MEDSRVTAMAENDDEFIVLPILDYRGFEEPTIGELRIRKDRYPSTTAFGFDIHYFSGNGVIVPTHVTISRFTHAAEKI